MDEVDKALVSPLCVKSVVETGLNGVAHENGTSLSSVRAANTLQGDVRMPATRPPACASLRNAESPSHQRSQAA